MEYFSVISFPLCTESAIGRLMVSSLSRFVVAAVENAATVLDSPVFLIVMVRVLFVPRLALVSVKFDVVPRVKIIVSSNSYILSLLIVISNVASKIVSDVVDAGMTSE
jgi:hypothetical protein